MNGSFKFAILACLSSLLGFNSLLPAEAQGGPQPQYRTEPTHHHQANLWRQYLDAGVKSEQGGNPQLAKRYYMGALSALEQKSKTRRDVVKGKLDGKSYRIPFSSVSVQQLEDKLASMYPTDWSKAPGTASQQLALRQEQVNVLYRVAQLNKAHSGSDSIFADRSEKRYEAAAEALKQAKGEPTTADGK
jgi:hypothetical protein